MRRVLTFGGVQSETSDAIAQHLVSVLDDIASNIVALGFQANGCFRELRREVFVEAELTPLSYQADRTGSGTCHHSCL